MKLLEKFDANHKNVNGNNHKFQLDVYKRTASRTFYSSPKSKRMNGSEAL